MVKPKRKRPVRAENNRRFIRANQTGIQNNRRRIDGLKESQDFYAGRIRDNLDRITSLDNNIDQTLGNRASEQFIELGDRPTNNKTIEEILDEQKRRAKFINQFKPFDIGSATISNTDITSGLTDKLYQTEILANRTEQRVNKAREQSVNAIAGLLAISTATFSALGSVLDVANQTLLSTIFTAVNTVRAVQTATAGGTFGLSALFTAVVGVASISALLVQSYQIRQNRSESAQTFGQIGASLQAVSVIGAIA